MHLFGAYRQHRTFQAYSIRKKLSKTVIVILIASSFPDKAAPSRMEANAAGHALVKRGELERTVFDLEDLRLMRAERKVLKGEFFARKYTVDAYALDAIKSAKLSPLALHHFATKVTSQPVAIQGDVLVFKTRLIMASYLWKLFV